MGLLVSIYRSDYDSTANAFHGKSQVVVLNLSGPFSATEDRPAAKYVWREPSRGGPIIVPMVDDTFEDMVGPMFGGTFAHTSDSRFPFNGALPIHDRFETAEQYAMLSV